jgi:asparagine synthase (glutamine-hydrolysing)
MCGIAGIAYAGDRDDRAAGDVRSMITVQRHRGPDGEGFHESPGVALGHCRLAIIDLHKTGRQPMPDETGRYWITFNGEIYNYIELRSELEKLGHSFRGHSDTEVLITAYAEWREACLQKLRGMFAFAIWDTTERTLFAARDRLGIKPFHYWADGDGRFCFASEIKALLPFLPARRVNRDLASHYLAWNLLEHEPGETMIDGIRRLPAAHCLTWNRAAGRRIRRYWDLSVSDEVVIESALRGDRAARFRREFLDAVSIHLRSDVPVGTCLSGGLDSSAIVCAIDSELRERGMRDTSRQHTFSATFPGRSVDERTYINEVTRVARCDAHFVAPTGERLREEMDRWLWHQEEPVGGTSAYAQYCVARLSRENGVKVLLDGQGADEQLAGYRKFILVYLRQLVHAGRWIEASREALAFFGNPDVLRTTRFIDGWRYVRRSNSIVELLWPSGAPPRPSSMGISRSLGARIKADLMHFSLPVLLRYEDRNTMAFGVESRVPFVDHVLVEWLAALPAQMRLFRGWTKAVLREGLAGLLPERIRTRKTKIGFSTPESEWLAGPLAPWVEDTLTRPRYLPDVVDRRGVGEVLRRFRAGDRSGTLQNAVCRLAIYEAWAGRFLRADS